MYKNIAKSIAVQACIAITILSFFPFLGISEDTTQIPAVKSELESWFGSNVGPYLSRKSTLDPQLVSAEDGSPKIIRVRQDGSGDFKTVNEAVNSIPEGNAKRIVVDIGSGIYYEKIKVEKAKPFVTFLGSSKDIPTLTYNLAAYQCDAGGVLESATLHVESDYFVAANIKIVNSSPMPDGKKKDAQAVALRISGDKAAFYNCKIIGFQDTLCDDKGNHFFKNCYIEGTVDFIFGNGKSLYLSTEVRVVANGVIAAQARKSNSEDTGYSFVHCTVTGRNCTTILGRAWFDHSTVVYSYTSIDSVVNPQGWSNNGHPVNTIFLGEYKCSGPGSNPKDRVRYAKQLSDEEAKPYLSLAFIEGSKWLLPPPKV